MSGHPTVEGVALVLARLQRMEDLDASIERLEEAVRTLDSQRQERAQLWQALQKQLGSMDLMQVGNYGHEARLGVFVAEMRRQLKREDQR